MLIINILTLENKNVIIKYVSSIWNLECWCVGDPWNQVKLWIAPPVLQKLSIHSYHFVISNFWLHYRYMYRSVSILYKVPHNRLFWYWDTWISQYIFLYIIIFYGLWDFNQHIINRIGICLKTRIKLILVNCHYYLIVIKWLMF